MSVSVVAEQAEDKTRRDDLHDFLIVFRRALLTIVCYVERRYSIDSRHCPDCPLHR